MLNAVPHVMPTWRMCVYLLPVHGHEGNLRMLVKHLPQDIGNALLQLFLRLLIFQPLPARPGAPLIPDRPAVQAQLVSQRSPQHCQISGPGVCGPPFACHLTAHRKGHCALKLTSQRVSWELAKGSDRPAFTL